ncbi:hypothetical protein MHU86_7242 [Fragilaria crotonensis]|nr:hypothetical protein MHU86_7242 [Fragilaria crotonensis]
MKGSRLLVSILIVVLGIGDTLQCHCFLSSQHQVHTTISRRGRTCVNTNVVVSLSKGEAASHRLETQESGDGGVADDVALLFDTNTVSDAEALLACRAYLQRKNRLGWKRAKERKELRQEATSETGFFWESSEQSVYRNKREEEDIDFDQGEDSSSQGKVEQVSATDTDRQEEPGIFTEMPTGPNKRSEIRSRVKKEQWQDAEFRKRWYESRWGDHVKPTIESNKQLRLQTKLLEIPTSILESPEFSMLTDGGNRRGDHIRSERAKKAYQTRTETAAKSTTPKVILTSNGQTPKEALLRIVADLDANLLPKVEDVKTMMKATRLSGRKEVLRRILKEKFSLRGKCYPQEDGPAIYVTEALVVQLGQLVIKLLTGRTRGDNKLK